MSDAGTPQRVGGRPPPGRRPHPVHCVALDSFSMMSIMMTTPLIKLAGRLRLQPRLRNRHGALDRPLLERVRHAALACTLGAALAAGPGFAALGYFSLGEPQYGECGTVTINGYVIGATARSHTRGSRQHMSTSRMAPTQSVSRRIRAKRPSAPVSRSRPQDWRRVPAALA